mgnify:CR=1 FL=1
MNIAQFEKRLEEGSFQKLCEKHSIEDVHAVHSFPSGLPDGFTEWIFEGYKMPDRKKFVVSTHISDVLTDDTAAIVRAGEFNVQTVGISQNDMQLISFGDFVKDLAQEN